MLSVFARISKIGFSDSSLFSYTIRSMMRRVDTPPFVDTYEKTTREIQYRFRIVKRRNNRFHRLRTVRMLRNVLHTELFVAIDTAKGRSTTLVHMLARIDIAEESVTLCTNVVHELSLISINGLGIRPHIGDSRESRHSVRCDRFVNRRERV